MRSLRRACAAGIACAVLIPLAAFGWQRLDHRPAWVMSILVTSESKDEARARADERRAFNDLLRRIERPRIAIDLHKEGQRRTGDGTTFEAQRTVVIRSEDEAPLTAVKLAAQAVPQTTMIAEPRRATHISDFALAFVLVAMLLTLATLERSGLSDADPFVIDAPRVVLLFLGLGFLASGAAVAGNVWNASLIPFVAVAAAPIALWFARARTYWTREPALRPRYTAFACLAGIVAAAWIARWLGAFA